MSTFEKFDKPDKKHESDEYVCGTWALEKVEYIASAAAGYAGPTPNEEKYCIMSRKRIWRCVWHGRSTLSDATKSERTWRRLSKFLCYEEGFAEMKRTCAYCGMFDDEDDILVRCQGPDCSLRSADYEIPGVFHGRCAAALGHSGIVHGAHLQSLLQ